MTIKRVLRHKFDIGQVRQHQKTLAESVEENVADLEHWPQGITILCQDLLDMAINEQVLTGDTGTVREHLIFSNLLRTVFFDSCTQPGPTIALEIPGRGHVDFPKIDLTGSTHVGTWIDQFELATIVRRRDMIERLIAFPDNLLRASRSKSGEYAYILIDTLKGFWRRDDETPDLLQAALDATEPSRLREDEIDFVLNIPVYEMGLLLKLIEGTVDGFNEVLEKALIRHKKYWSEPERADDPRGFIAFGPLAFASIAYQWNYPITVESDYLPKELYEGRGLPVIWSTPPA